MAKVYIKKYGRSFKPSELKWAQARAKGLKKKQWLRAKNIAIGIWEAKERKFKTKAKKKEAKEELKEAKEELMWRVTVALNYSLHNNYYSYKITGYFKTEKEANKKIEEYNDRVISQVKKIVGQKKENWTWFSGDPNVELEDVPMRRDLLGKEKEKDETVGVKNREQADRIKKDKKRKNIPLTWF